MPPVRARKPEPTRHIWNLTPLNTRGYWKWRIYDDELENYQLMNTDENGCNLFVNGEFYQAYDKWGKDYDEKLLSTAKERQTIIRHMRHAIIRKCVDNCLCDNIRN